MGHARERAQAYVGTMGVDQKELWDQVVGEAWVRHAAAYDTTLAPFGHVVIDALAPGADDRVLDVGCGTGTTTLDLAALAPAGEVVGIDLSATMLGEARRRAERADVTTVRFVEADAQTADLGLQVFDVVFSRFGVMFFSDPAAAFANLAAAMVPDGRLGFVCFGSPIANPFMLVPVFASAQLLDLSLPDPDAPGPFSLADPDRTAALLHGAGFTDVVIESGPDEAVLGDAQDLESLATRLLEQNPATASRLQIVAAPTRSAAIRSTAQALAEHRSHGQVVLGAATWLVTARVAV